MVKTKVKAPSPDSSDEDIDVGDNTVPNPDEVDDSICIICNGTTYIGETISCETCYLWFHFQCVGVTHNDDCVKKEDVPFFCPTCRGKSAKKPNKKKEKKKQKATPKPAPQLATPQQTRTPSTSIVSGKRERKSNPKYSDGGVIPPPIPVTPSPTPVAQSPLASSSNKGLKLKISFKGPPKSEKSSPVAAALSPEYPKQPKSDTSDADDGDRKRKRRRSEEEEERWLDAVEAGNLPSIDEELKSIKDPKLMTARQRAMLERQRTGEEISFEGSGHMALDYGFKKKEESEETLKQKAIKSQKRKELEMEKREQDKKKTMDRLLKKKDSKVAKQIKTSRSNRRSFPKVTYRHDSTGPSISVPVNFSFPMEARGPISPPETVTCAMCDQPKKYACAKSGKPLCSLTCYKQNQSVLVAAV